MRHKWRAILWLFLLGATLGTALDAIHVYSNTEHYPPPTILGLAWWVPLLFGAAAVAIGYSHPMVDPLLHHVRSRRLVSSIGELTWLLLAYLISASEIASIAKAGLILIIYLNFLVVAGKSWQNVLLSLVTAITGTLVEMILVTVGAFKYTHPEILGLVPYWLPFLYICASLAVGDLGRSLLAVSARTRGTS
jgi:hypothetical protein